MWLRILPVNHQLLVPAEMSQERGRREGVDVLPYRWGGPKPLSAQDRGTREEAGGVAGGGALGMTYQDSTDIGDQVRHRTTELVAVDYLVTIEWHGGLLHATKVGRDSEESPPS